MNREETIQKDRLSEGGRRYEAWRDKLMADPENRRIYEEEAAKRMGTMFARA